MYFNFMQIPTDPLCEFAAKTIEYKSLNISLRRAYVISKKSETERDTDGEKQPKTQTEEITRF